MLVFIVVGILPLVPLVYLTASMATGAVRREAVRGLEGAATASARAVGQQMNGLAELVDSYAHRPSLIKALQGGPKRYDRAMIAFNLEELQRARPGITAAFLADPAGVGIDIAPFTPTVIGADFSFRDWYKGVTAGGGPYVSEVFIAALESKPRVVAVSALVRESTSGARPGKTLGVIVVAYGTATIDAFTEEFARAEGVRLTVTDQRGILAAAPEVTTTALVSLRNDPLVSAALAGRSGHAEIRRHGARALSAFAPVPRIGWTVIAELPAAVAFSEVSKLGSAVLVMAIVFGLIVLAGVGLLALTMRERAEAERRSRDSEERARLAQQAAEGSAEALRAADELKNVFLRAASHDLRSRVAAILGFAQLLMRRDVDLPEEDRRDMIDEMGMSARRMERMLEDLLDIDRLSRDILKPRRYQVDVETILRRVAEESRLATRRPFEVEMDVGMADVDPTLVERMVDNLIINAEKHTPPGTPIWLRVRHENGGLMIVVEDAGPGVPEGDRTEIFEPFRRGSEGSSRPPGSGIGLHLVSQFAHLHGGRAWVEERPGGGASFHVFLPDAEAVSAAMAGSKGVA